MATEQVLGMHHRWTCDLCGYHRSDYGPETASRIQARHVCKENPMANGKTVILLCWEELDKVVDELMPLWAKVQGGDIGAFDMPRLEHLKAKARGMAEIMCIWAVPHFRTADDIAAEATARYRARQAGKDHHTLGTIVGTASADLAVTLGTTTSSRPAATRTTPRPAPSKQFAPEEVTAIKAAFGAGFDLKMLATAYKCTEDNIKAVLNG